jgi:hypothetical protein
MLDIVQARRWETDQSSKSPVRSCEDVDETALSYAEIILQPIVLALVFGL